MAATSNGLARILFALTFVVLAAAGPAGAQPSSRFLEEAFDLKAIEAALDRERPAQAPPATVTGVSVPHHMLAADLIARGIWAASSGRYERVLILSPDHFRVLRTPFGVTTAGFESATGAAPGDSGLAHALLEHEALFSDIGAASSEHGVQSVVPFVHAVFPEAKIIAVTAAVSSKPADWEQAAALISGLIGPQTLVVQSTDYSHHLPHHLAVLRDQETLAIIATADPEASLVLDQPQHLDSRAAQFIQMRLQQRLFGAAPVVVANRNSSDYIPGAGGTTSYVVTVFTTDHASGGAFRYSDHDITFIGGDTLAGRGFTGLLQDTRLRRSIVDAVLDITHGAPLVLNLEGVMLEERPAGTSGSQLFMTERLTLPLLRDLNVSAVSLANNHAWDFGEQGLVAMRDSLSAAGVAPLQHGVVSDLGPFRVLPLSLKRSFFYDHPVIRSEGELAAACPEEARPPLIALPHWGEDYSSDHGPFEFSGLQTLAACGVSAVIGAHSHKASSAVGIAAGGAIQSVFSVGNFLFDQRGDKVSGALVEVRAFKQGTVALRLVPLPNLYERTVELAGERFPD